MIGLEIEISKNALLKDDLAELAEIKIDNGILGLDRHDDLGIFHIRAESAEVLDAYVRLEQLGIPAVNLLESCTNGIVTHERKQNGSEHLKAFFLLA